MDNVVTISNVKPNVLEFNADIQGVDTSDMAVKFIINANGMDLGFVAEKMEGTKWEVKIPALTMLERTAYPFKMDVTSDGYHFEPLQGTANIVGSHDVYTSTPAQKLTPAQSKPTVEEAQTKITPKIEQPAYVIEAKKVGPGYKPTTKKPTTPDTNTLVEKIMKSVTIPPTVVEEVKKPQPIKKKVVAKKAPPKKVEAKKLIKETTKKLGLDDKVKSILTQVPSMINVSQPITEKTNVKVGGSSTIFKKVTGKETKPVVKEPTKIVKEKVASKVDLAVSDILTEDNTPVEKKLTINKLKKVSS